MALSIKKLPLSASKYPTKCPYVMNPTRIVIHNTANDASADAEIRYMQSNSNQVSFHYAVDDKEAVQGIELWRNAWHAGDGANGLGNRQGIAIEICYSKSGGTRFAKAEENAAELTAKLLLDFKWDLSKVTKHVDYAPQKFCPHRTMELGWQRFLDMVEAKRKSLLGIKTSKTTERMTLNGYTIERANDFSIVYWDKSKKSGTADSYINGGFFGYYKENGINFTLPAGNLVCDIDITDVPIVAVPYLKPFTKDQKFRFGSMYDNGNFKNKPVSTLVLPHNGVPYVDEVTMPPHDARYAISGIPVVRDGVDVSFKDFVKKQGWDDSPFYATSRNLIGLKGSSIYIISGTSKTNNFIATSEVYEKLLPFGFEQILSLDGGGSYYHKYQGKADFVWSDRNVNNLIIY